MLRARRDDLSGQQLLLWNVIITLSYVLTGKLGHLFALPGTSISAIWPPAGLALVAILMFGWRVFPGILLGAFCVGYTGLLKSSSLIPDLSGLVAGILMAAGSTLGALAGGYGLRRVVTRRPGWRDVSHTALLFLIGATGNLISATIGTASLCGLGQLPTEVFNQVWLTWWFGDTLGVFVFAPLLLTFTQSEPAWAKPRNFEGFCVIGLTAIVCSVVFLDIDSFQLTTQTDDFALLPFLIWGALRLGVRHTSIMLAVVSTIIVVGTAQGVGPYARPDMADSFLCVSASLSLGIPTILLMAVATQERRQLEYELQVTNQDLEQQILNRTANLAQANRRLTEEMELHKELARELTNLAAIVQSSDQAIISKSLDGVITFWNPGAEKIYGYRSREIIGQSIKTLMPPGRENAETAILDSVCQGQGTAHYKTQQRRKDGSLFDTEITAFAIRNSAGKILGTAKITRDITARQQAEAAARESQERLTLAVRAANIGYWDANLKTDEVHYSPEWKSHLGYAADELPGNFGLWRSLLHPEDRPAAEAKVADYLAGRIPNYAIEFRLRHKDGSYRWIYSRGELLNDKQGKPTRLLGCHLDITERKQADLKFQAFALLGKRLSAAATVQEAAQLIAEMADALLGWDAAALVMFDEKTGLCRSVLNVDLVDGTKTKTQSDFNDRPPSPRMQRVIQHGAELILRAQPDQVEGEFARFGNKARPSASLMYVPVHDDQRTVAMLTIQSYRANAYTAADLDTLQALADHCGGALARIRSRELQLESERGLVTAQIQARLGSWEFGFETQKINWSQAMYSLLGRDAALGPMTIEEFLPRVVPDDEARVLAVYNRLPEFTAKQTFEFDFNRPDEVVRHFTVTLECIRNEQGHPIKAVGVLQDITERHQAEKLAQESQERLALAVRAANIGYWDLDLDRQTVHISPEWKLHLGYGPDELPTDFSIWPQLIHPEDLEQAMAGVQEYIKGRSPAYSMEFRLRCQDGSYRWIHARGQLIQDPNGKQTRLIGCHIDITERKRHIFEMEMFAQLGKQLGATETASQGARLVVDAADHLFHWDACWLRGWNESQQDWHELAKFDLVDGERREIPNDPDAMVNISPLIRSVMDHGPRLLLRESELDEPQPTVFGNGRRSLSLMFVPLRQAEKLIGILSIQSYRRQAYTATDLAGLQMLADHCAGAFARIQTTAALRVSEERFRHLWDNSTEGMRLTNREGLIISVNHAFCRIMHQPQEALQGQLLTAPYARDLQEITLAQYRENFAHRNIPPRLDGPIMLANGKTIWLEVSSRLIETVPNQPLILSAFRDITARKNSEAALQRSEMQYAELVNNVDGIVWEADASTLQMRFVSHQATRILGYSTSDWITNPKFWEEHIHPEDREATVRYASECTSRGESYNLEYRMIAADRRTVWLADFVTVIREGSKPVTRRGILVDITPRKLLEAEQVQSLSLLQATIESSEDGLLVVDRDGRIRIHNQRFEDLWRIPAKLRASRDDQQLLDFVLQQLNRPDDFLAGVKYLYSHPDQESFDVLTFKDGRIYERYSRPQRLENEIGGRVWSFRDVTERRSNERLVQGQAKILESIATGLPLPQTLAELCRTAEDSSPEMRCSVLLLDEDGLHLRHGAAPNMPLSFCQAVDGYAIGPKACSCGTAAYRESTVIVDDIETDPLWADFKDHALALGFRSCWSTPVFNHAREVMGTLAFYYPTKKRPSIREQRIIEMVTHTAAIAILKHRSDEQLARSGNILRQLSGNLLEAQEAERRHLARELHDELGQTLTATKILLESLQQDGSVTNLEGMRQQWAPLANHPPLRTAIGHVETMLQQVRNLSLSLRPTILDDCGLPAALRWLLDQHTKTTGRPALFELKQYDGSPDSALETACFRIAQEALTNISRHSQAQKVNVELQCDPEHLTLVVRDDGLGFDVNQATRRAHAGASAGLLGQQERAALLGGRVEIVSQPGMGTELRVWFPVTTQKLSIAS